MNEATLAHQIEENCAGMFSEMTSHYAELTLTAKKENMLELFNTLKSHEALAFEMLIDLSVVDYLHYGISDWETNRATEDGFSRAMEEEITTEMPPCSERFAVVYHLLSVTHNHRLRVKIPVSEKDPVVLSVHDIWKGANWFEREGYDLFGILFENHPDLRRILTDYGFIGHPFRKDFPLSGHVEMRYDATQKRVIYDPVQIVPRTVPKVIRKDNRYLNEGESKK